MTEAVGDRPACITAGVKTEKNRTIPEGLIRLLTVFGFMNGYNYPFNSQSRQ
jgi:hypothetical protein